MSIREEFEAAFIAEEVRLLGEGYRSTAQQMLQHETLIARCAWWAWQASREALVVELPEWNESRDADYACGISDCREAIQAAGVKVKP